MTAAPLLLIALVAGREATVVAVTTMGVGSRQAVRIVTTGEVLPVEVDRGPGEVRIRVGAKAAPGLAAPSPVAPLERIALEVEGADVVVVVGVPDNATQEVRQQRGLVTVLFGSAQDAGTPPAAQGPSVSELYRLVFPSPADGESPQPGDEAPTGVEGDSPKRGLVFGPLAVRPSITAGYLESRFFREDGTSTRDRYVEIQPTLAAELSLLRGTLRAAYEPRFRVFSTLPELRRPTHVVTAGLERPLGSRVVLRAFDRYIRGQIEATEVDPGREYFLRLVRFTRNQLGGSIRLDSGSRVAVELSGEVNSVRIPTGTDRDFFSYDERTGKGSLQYELTPSLRLSLNHIRMHIPPTPQRALVETRSSTTGLALTGDLGAFMSGELAAGYERRTSPNAPVGGQRFKGVSWRGRLTRELNPGAQVAFSTGRSTHVSGFQENAFYVATSYQGTATTALPWSATLQASLGRQRNTYPRFLDGGGEPRRDQITSWSVGIARAVTRRAFVRADYRRETRLSNVFPFRIRTGGFSIQFGASVAWAAK